MAARIFSRKNRLPHLGPHSLEILPRQQEVDLTAVPWFQPMSFARPDKPHSIINAMCDHPAVLDAIRVGLVNPVMAATPGPVDSHTHAIVFLYETPRAPDAGERGTDWLHAAERHRSALLANETAAVAADYLRL